MNKWRVPEHVTHARARYKLHTARGPEQALFTTYTTKTIQNMNISGIEKCIVMALGEYSKIVTFLRIADKISTE
jgi:hypothetical protein